MSPRQRIAVVLGTLVLTTGPALAGHAGQYRATSPGNGACHDTGPRGSTSPDAASKGLAVAAENSDTISRVDYDADLDQACQVALEALWGVDGVQADPAPQAYLVEFGDSAMVIDLRYWTEAHQAEVRRVQHQGIVAVKQAYDRAGIDIPFPIRTLDARPGFGEALQRADGERVGAGVNS